MRRAATFPAFFPRTGPRVAILTVVFYVSFLVAAAPASVLAWALAHSTNGAVWLEGVEGGFWNGRAAAMLVEQRVQPVRYERLAWKWHSASLATGEFAVQLSVDDPYLRGTGRLGFHFDGVRVSEAALRMPASSLAVYLPALRTGGLSGEVTLQSMGFTFGKDRYAGVATIEWRDATTTLSSVRPLGDYRAIVTGTGAHADFQVETIRGVLRLEGRGAWFAQEPPVVFRGTARGEEASKPELVTLLGQLGPDLGQGVHRLALPKSHGDAR